VAETSPADDRAGAGTDLLTVFLCRIGNRACAGALADEGIRPPRSAGINQPIANHQTRRSCVASSAENRSMDDIQKETRRAGAEAAETARQTADKGTARAREAIERTGAAAREAVDTMSASCATTLRTAQEYSGKVVEFTLA